ncbi:hypothetical protein SFV1gp09 [Sulfolobus filamentous virus 1]|uniref:Uncharacterized protein n=2 Tax=Alphalipothrixvirus beppuense TaxID=2734584 RepID=A0A346LU48_SUFV1|nr:hypothetical protein HOT91_gp09 [Sulfolobus filamentous virus 1]AXQ00091.1 hypothetical protein SFV1gp09 [Sulfolobus filamentous virus 1]AZI75711.1 hypothetical protein SBFV1_gp10 [Sulfolobales Beppu filamentous phage 1]
MDERLIKTNLSRRKVGKETIYYVRIPKALVPLVKDKTPYIDPIEMKIIFK